MEEPWYGRKFPSWLMIWWVCRLALIDFLLIIGVFLAKSHDDFGYYHLPNALHFSQNKIEFGLGNLNHGFKHHSSIFYLY